MGVGRSMGSLSPRDFTIFADKLKSRYSWVFEFAESDLKALAPADDGENAEKVNTKAHSSCTMDATIHGNTAVSHCHSVRYLNLMGSERSQKQVP